MEPTETFDEIDNLLMDDALAMVLVYIYSGLYCL